MFLYWSFFLNYLKQRKSKFTTRKRLPIDVICQSKKSKTERYVTLPARYIIFIKCSVKMKIHLVHNFWWNILGGRESDVLVYRFAEVVGRMLGWRGYLPLLTVWVLHNNRRQGGHLFCIVQFYRLPALKKRNSLWKNIIVVWHRSSVPLGCQKSKNGLFGAVNRTRQNILTQNQADVAQ